MLKIRSGGCPLTEVWLTQVLDEEQVASANFAIVAQSHCHSHRSVCTLHDELS